MSSHETENKEALESLSSGYHGDPIWKKVLVGLGLGILAGYALGPELNLIPHDTALAIGEWLALPGNLFLTMIRFIVIPLVLASVALGIANGNDIASVKRIGTSVILFFLAGTAASIFFGITLTELFSPGSYIDQSQLQDIQGSIPNISDQLGSDGASLPQTIVGILPTNPLASMAQGEMLQVVIASIIFGIALLMIPNKESTPLIDTLASVQSACMAIVGGVMKIVPIAVFGLIANALIQYGIDALIGMGAFVGTFLLVLVMVFIFYMLVLVLYSRRNPIDFIRQVREPLIVAFSTSSSSATMPVTMRTVEQKAGIHPSISSLVIPLGATVNMGGTAAYQAVVVIFLAQFYGISLGPEDIALLLAMSIGGAIGTPGMPGGTLPILAGILIKLGIPAEGIGFILGVDRILDMCRTTLNVTGDMVACTVVERATGIKGEQSK